MNKLLNISEVAKVLDLVNPKTNKPLNHILRYWEKEFKVIRPKKINELDDHDTHSLKAHYYKDNIEKKSKLLLEKIRKIKIYGKKNSS